MTRLRYSTLAGLMLMACTGCAQDLFATHNTPQDLQNMQQGAASTKSSTKTASLKDSTSSPGGATSNYASAGADCDNRAHQRMSMYDRPDTYPISDQERHDAYLALYSSCMRENNWQVAGPVRGGARDASQLAALAPAAGGRSPSPVSTVNAGNTLVSSSSVPGATVVVIGGGKDSVNQLSSLSPSSGGSYPTGATVVMISAQQPAAAMPQQGYYAPPAGPLPVAVPIAPTVAKAYTPAPAAQAPAPAALISTPLPGSPAYAHYTPQSTAPALPAGESYPPHPHPSLAGAEGALTGNNGSSSAVAESEKANRQLENVLEQ